MTRDDVRMYRFRRGPIYGARPYTHASGLPGSHRWNWAGSINRTPTILSRYGVHIAARVSSMTRDDVRMYRFRRGPIYGARPYTHASGLPGSHRWNWAGSINRTPTILNRYGVRIAARVSSMTRDDVRMYRFVGAPFMAPANPQGPMYNTGKRVR
jgi:hypothetical protein